MYLYVKHLVDFFFFSFQISHILCVSTLASYISLNMYKLLFKSYYITEKDCPIFHKKFWVIIFYINDHFILG
jgi:hypothetical protein